MELKTVCVYCSAAATAPDWLKGEAAKFGAGMAARGWRLIYGGASVGVMGALADAVHSPAAHKLYDPLRGGMTVDAHLYVAKHLADAAV